MSHDRACGPFYFDPPPAPDQPVSIRVTVSPPHPVVGQPVTFHVVMDDPDGPIGCVGFESDGVMAMSSECGFGPMCDRFGSWPPPAPSAGHQAVELTETYHQPGQYTFQMGVWPGFSACKDARTGRLEQPYVSSGSISTTITVS